MEVEIGRGKKGRRAYGFNRRPLVAPFETSFGRTTSRRIILVKVFSDGLAGWGECTVGEHPFYNHESTESCWMIIRDYIAPMIMK